MSYKLIDLKTAAAAGGRRLESIPGDLELIQDALIGGPDNMSSLPSDATPAETKRVLPALKKIKRRIEDNCKSHIEVIVLLETMMWVWIEEVWKDHPLDPLKSHRSWHRSRNLTEVKCRLFNMMCMARGYPVHKDKWRPNKAKLRAAEKKRIEGGDDDDNIVTRSFLEFHPDKPVKAKKASPEKRKGLAESSDNNPSKKTKKASASILKDATESYAPPSEYAAFTEDAATALKSWIEHYVVEEKDAKTRCWQVRCVGEDPYFNGERKRLRVLVVSGATPMFALTKFVAAAFAWRHGDGLSFDPTLTKGKVPDGSHWTVERNEGDETKRAGIVGTQAAAYKAAGKGAPFFHDKKVKVYQLLRNRGDTLIYRCDGDCKVTLRVDGIETEAGYYKARYTPKLVGADDWSIRKFEWSDLNARFLQNKPSEMVLTSSFLTEEEREDVVNNQYKLPLFDSKGKGIDQHDNGFAGIAAAHNAVAMPFVE